MIDGLELRAEPEVVMSRVGSALLRGDTEGATSYLAAQSNMSSAQINTRVREISANLNQTSNEIKEAAGATLATLGCFAFLTLLCATIGACIGAIIESRKNETAPQKMWSVPHRAERAA